MSRDLRSEDLRQNHADAQHRRHHRDDDRKSLLCVFLPLFCEEASVDRYKGDGRRPTSHDVVQPVGNSEAGNIGIGLRPSAKRPRDICLANVPDHTGEHDRCHQQQGGRVGAVLM